MSKIVEPTEDTDNRDELGEFGCIPWEYRGPNRLILPLIPKLPETLEVCAMKGIAGVVLQGVAFSLTVVTLLFIGVNLPHVFTGNHHYFNVFFISMGLYFFLLVLSFLFSIVSTSLIFHNSQRSQQESLPTYSVPKHPTPPPRPPPTQMELDNKFLEFYTRQNYQQAQLLERVMVMQEQLNNIMKKHPDYNRSNTPSPSPQQETIPKETTPHPDFFYPDLPTCPANNPCTKCTRESRLCKDCLRNPSCKCGVNTKEENRIRKMAHEQEVQVTRMVATKQLKALIAKMIKEDKQKK